MNGAGLPTRAGTELARTGEWLHLVAGIALVFGMGGTRGVGVWLIALALPGAFEGRSRIGALAAPVSVAILASQSGTLDVGAIAALGALAGVGATLSGRPVAWVGGVFGSPGAGGILGAAAGAVFVFSGMARPALYLAAVLLLMGAVLGEQHPAIGERPSVLTASMFSMAFVAGLRVLETSLFERPEGAGVFATFWAIGLEIGWRSAPRADARLVMAAPFLVAVALTGVGAITGPGMVFAYAGAAFGVGLIGGTGFVSSTRRAGRAGWTSYLPGAVLGAIWALYSRNDFTTAIWGAAAVALGGGFVSSILARRIPAPAEATAESPAELVPQAVAAEAVLARAPEPAAVSFEELLNSAVEDLAMSLVRARTIRGEAIDAFRERLSVSPLHETRVRIGAAIDELADDVNRSRARLQRMAAN